MRLQNIIYFSFKFMERLTLENEPQPKNISKEFLQMDSSEFRKFIRSQKNEPSLHIEIDWVDASTARKIKAFLEDSNAYKRNQKRTATIRATEEQRNQEINVFESGVEWKQI
jgi:hypothetical protein